MMAGALIYLLGNEGATIEDYYKGVRGIFPDIGVNGTWYE